MVLFSEFYASVKQQRPEWSNKFLDFEALHDIVDKIPRKGRQGDYSADAMELMEPVVRIDPEPLLNTPTNDGDESPEALFLRRLRNDLQYKVTDFTLETLAKYEVYANEKLPKWTAPGYSADKARASMRYLARELTFLQNFHDANVLAAKKLVLKFNNRDVSRTITEEEYVGDFERLGNEIGKLNTRMQFAYASAFNTSVDKAKAQLLPIVLPPKNIFRIGVFSGWLAPGALLLYFLIYEMQLPDALHAKLVTCLAVYRFCCVFTMMLWSWAGVLWVMRKYRINHAFILGLKPVPQLTWMHVADAAAMFTAFWLFCLVLYLRAGLPRGGVVETELHHLQPIFTILVFVVFLGALFLPFKHLYHTARTRLIRTLGLILMLPFGKRVHFRQFFVTDWLTSMTQSYADFMYTCCYFVRGDLQAETLPECSDFTNKWKHLIIWIPFFWRLVQCGKMYRLTQNRLHLYNAGKYTTSIVYLLFNALYTFYPQLRIPVILIRFASTIYSFVWDTMIDWGWIKGKERNRMFPVLWVYAVAIGINFFCRFFFITSLLGAWPTAESERWVFALLEILRRAHWSVYRLENEHCNNIEKYRRVDYVPDVGLNE